MKKMKRLLVVILAILLVIPLVPTGAKADTQGLVAYYKFDGDVNDASGNGMNGTAIGNITYGDSVDGKGAKFDGTSYIEVNHNDLLNLENGFTLSVWIYKEQANTQMYEPLLVKTDTANHKDAFYFFNNQDKPGIEAWQGNAPKFETSKQWIDMQKWSLCSVTVDSGNIRFYIDGKLIGSKPAAMSFQKSTGKLYIGFKDNASFGQDYFKGMMDDLKIYNYAMTPAEIQKEYATIADGVGKYIISRAAGLVAFYQFESNLNDTSGYGNNGTAVAEPTGLTYVDGIAGKALKFDGKSYIEVPDSDTLDMDRGFTCSVWINVDSYRKSGKDYQPIIDKMGGDSFLWGKMTSYKVLLGFDDRSVLAGHRGLSSPRDGWSAQNSTPRKPNQWYMLTITSNMKTVKAYVDGVFKNANEREMFIPHSLGKLLIGAGMDKEKYIYYKGIMDELRIYNYEMNANEVKSLYTLRDSLTLKAPKTVISKSEKVQLTATLKAYKFTSPVAEDGYGTNVVVLKKGVDSFVSSTVTTKVKYSSTNSKVLTVSSGGQVTGVAKGDAGAKGVYNTVISAQQMFKVK